MCKKLGLYMCVVSYLVQQKNFEYDMGDIVGDILIPNECHADLDLKMIHTC